MSARLRTVALLLGLQSLSLAIPQIGYAYGGPGSVVTGIGTLVAVLAAATAALFGFVWFPVKRLIAKFRRDTSRGEGPQTPQRIDSE